MTKIAVSGHRWILERQGCSRAEHLDLHNTISPYCGLNRAFSASTPLSVVKMLTIR